MKKSVRNPINKIKKPIEINLNGRDSKDKKKNNLRYLKQRYALHYRNANWVRAEEYNQYSISNFQVNLRDWMEGKENSKMNNKNDFGFSNKKKIKYG